MIKKIGVILTAFKIAGRPIEKMMQAGPVHRVIGWANAAETGDIGKFADPCIGDISVAIAIGVIIYMAVQNTRPLTDFGIGPKGGIPDLAIRMDQGAIAAEFFFH